MAQLLNKFLIGCDPEFIGLSREGNLINFRNHSVERVGPVGYDHDGWVAEVRPEPAKGTYTLLKRIQALVQGLPNFRGVEKLRAGAVYNATSGDRQNATMGGHVHLDISPFTAQTKTYSTAHYQRVGALDNLTQYLEAIEVLPQEESRVRRANSRYGRPGDFRAKGDMLNPRFEYRAMASWLHNPASAMLALTGAKIACVDPDGTIESLKPRSASLEGFFRWLEKYSKDINVKRVLEKLTFRPQSPDGDIKERWAELPC